MARVLQDHVVRGLHDLRVVAGGIRQVRFGLIDRWLRNRSFHTFESRWVPIAIDLGVAGLFHFMTLPPDVGNGNNVKYVTIGAVFTVVIR